MKACPKCSAVSETEKSFCPECGTSYNRLQAEPGASAPTTKVNNDLVRMLAIAGLTAYLLSWLLVPLLNSYWSWGETFKGLLGIEALSMMADSFSYGLPMLGRAISGYLLLSIVIITSTKPS